MKNLNRRDFIQQTALVGFLLSLSPSRLFAYTKKKTNSYQAFDGTSEISQYQITSIEGQIPEDLNVDLYKVSTGEKIKFGKQLNHFFDGDAFAYKARFSNGQFSLNSQYIKTPEFVEEQAAQKLIYDEFGTKGTGKRKNNPSINIIPWGNQFLALSESGLPALLDKELNFIEYHNFNGTLPDNFSFTAHPKIDPETGDLYTYGTIQGPSLALKIYKISPKTNKAIEIYSKAQWRFFMIHDMFMTKDYVGLIIPPASASIFDLLNPKRTMSENIKYDNKRRTRILIVPKEDPIANFELEMPSCMVFHNANAFQNGDELTVYSLLSRDGSLLDVIDNWGDEFEGKFTPSALTKIDIDLKYKRIIDTEELIYNHEFPTWNKNVKDGKNRYIYLTEMGESRDPYHFKAITKYDYLNNSHVKYQLDSNQIVGEVLLANSKDSSQEDSGYLIFNGYDLRSNTSFFQILNAQDLSFVARINLKSHLPVGLHGSLV